MSEHLAIAVALVVIAVCSIVFVMSMPALVVAAVRGKGHAALRLAAGMALLAAVTMLAAAAVGASSAGYAGLG